MHSFAQIQRTLLKSAGVRVKQWRSEAAFYAGNALSTTLPGGPVLSATFVYRQQRLWGASPVVASWQLVMSGALQVVGLALLGLGGAFLLGASNNPFSLIFTVGGFVALLLLAQAVATRPDLIDGIGVGCCPGSTRRAANRPTPGCRSGGRPSNNSSRSAWAAAIWVWRSVGRCSTGWPTLPAWRSRPTPPAGIRRWRG